MDDNESSEDRATRIGKRLFEEEEARKKTAEVSQSLK